MGDTGSASAEDEAEEEPVDETAAQVEELRYLRGDSSDEQDETNDSRLVVGSTPSNARRLEAFEDEKSKNQFYAIYQNQGLEAVQEALDLELKRAKDALRQKSRLLEEWEEEIIGSP